ncbi:Hypothetical predicted protein [Octopus vulgaris]|uniref:Fibrinogen C-terminal domain-containing protein n=2 Tax=Octopus TaxID=6643 RepID=A0AA36BH78_OCTVU|nr:Hypothetical predicted protein [Octopus vulgaris]
MVEDRLKKFEKDFPGASGTMSAMLGLKRENNSARVLELDMRLNKLSGDVLDTRSLLESQHQTLRSIRDQVNTQKEEIGRVGENFTILEGVVRNLSMIADHLQELLPSVYATTTAYTPITPQTTEAANLPRDCHEMYERSGRKLKGVFFVTIRPKNAPYKFKVQCRIFNDSGWVVFQKRQDGSVDFFKRWNEYKKGFGNLDAEFWIGNDNLHYLTNQGDTKLRIQMTDWEDKSYYAEYDYFRVSNEKDLYRLTVRGYHGTAGDSLTSYWEKHDGMPFSTVDQDNDGRYYDNCADYYHGAWWFNNCFDSHLNGRYYKKGHHNNYFVRDGVQWNSIHLHSSLKKVEMLLKPADVISNEL